MAEVRVRVTLHVAGAFGAPCMVAPPLPQSFSAYF